MIADLAQSVSTGEAVAFWILAPLALIGAVGLVMARSAIHGALMLALTMICLAVFYIMQSAPFLGFVQIMVYTGAIMMLFLFVLMLFGRDSRDSMFETLRGQRFFAAVLAIGLVGLLAAGLGHAVTGLTIADGPPTATGAAAGDSNVAAIAESLFTTYIFPFEVVSGVLTVAAVGALMFAHVARKGAARGQKEASRERFAPGNYPGPRPGPGVFATSDSTATPALLPDGSIAGESLSEHVPARELTAAETAPKHTEGKDLHR
ncbi:NADH-quinone oxidoreductase subunit J [Glycomyces xiaoerkulensis]|uniref:NADH-quinone oxidoreductase subunit J n=1 Tax=Glycomyces xiaoerkulensis TaxID=2038139 RepID=UPI000C25FFA8|nr:NADH-quinone oxidoreductase subunit J [Glycomyces xiaoerkulensis]